MGLPRSAIALAFGLAMLAGSVHAQQIFRCVDERGKTYYTEKPGPSCKPTRIDAEPGKPPAKAPAAKAPEGQPPRPVAKSAPAPLTREAHCRGLSREVAQADAGKSKLQPAAAAARRSAIDKEIAKSCE